MKDIAILIPARGGSKRIINKNIVLIDNKPLITYSLQEALKLTSEVYVSTDCKAISQICKNYGAKVIERPKELATDNSDVEDSLKHFLTNVKKEIIVLMQATSPLVKSSYIREGLELLDKYDSVISVCEVKEFFWSKDGKPINYIIGNKPRTQDMEPIFKENGAFYITSRKNFLNTNKLTNGKIGFVKMSYRESIDIDTNEDLEMLKIILERNKGLVNEN